MKTFPKIAAVVAVAGAAVFASVLPGSADVAAQSPSLGAVRVESPAILEARGAAVRVSVTIVCPAGYPTSVNLTVTQRSGGGVATGSDYKSPVTCTGTAQTIELTPTANGEAFRRGTAFASASMYVSGPGYVTDDREIEIVR
ncbi:hypothetical protein GCM10010492_44700 [Saccharothrix mutabilis subsp. mutabilis]|uniref:Uncharacterized protein n=1 Tax=Saccharothrix mutabilis subsp. mutabilis TaxID=66855 RepID=A0ABN0U6R0_9PSEU